MEGDSHGEVLNSWGVITLGSEFKSVCSMSKCLQVHAIRRTDGPVVDKVLER